MLGALHEIYKKFTIQILFFWAISHYPTKLSNSTLSYFIQLKFNEFAIKPLQTKAMFKIILPPQNVMYKKTIFHEYILL